MPLRARRPVPISALPGASAAPLSKLATSARHIRGEDCNNSASNPQEGRCTEEYCAECGLPLGISVHTDAAVGGLPMHQECLVQALMSLARKEEKARKDKDAAKKSACRAQHGIGWKPRLVTRNDEGPAAAMGCPHPELTHGLCCLALEELDNGNYIASIAQTSNPAASLNLEYLCLCLQVQRFHGKPPLFSLDPKRKEGLDGTSTMHSVVCYEPAWLEGTSAGEVMFQADVYLKELSMGEYTQPVLGMRSCLDLCQQEGLHEDWRAREWFVIQDAEIRMTKAGVLIPSVVMAVEARQQVEKPDGTLEDEPVIRRDHPLLRFAEEFTHNFNLIAERKSVIYHLRELAKAALVAKYLEDNGIDLDCELWQASARSSCCQEVPQLWNERSSPEVWLTDSETAKEVKVSRHVHGVYGGVNFGTMPRVVKLRQPNFDHRRPAFQYRPMLKDELQDAPQSSGVESRHAPGRGSARLPGLALQMRTETWTPGQGDDEESDEEEGFNDLADLQLRDRLSWPSGVLMMETVLGKVHDMDRAILDAYFSSGVPGPTGTDLVFMSSKEKVTKKGSPLAIAKKLKKGMKAGVAPFFGRLGPRPGDEISFGAFSFDHLRRRELQRGTENFLPQGVDLDLDSLELPAPDMLQLEDACDGKERPAATCGSIFWAAVLPGTASPFDESEKAFFRALYKQQLSDRAKEGSAFMPVDLSRSRYLMKLLSLLEEEEVVRDERLRCFQGDDFSMKNPGHLFPSSWSHTQHDGSGVKPAWDPALLAGGGQLLHRPDYQQEQVSRVLKGKAPVFEECTEDGVIFRIYQVGRLEVRTTEEPNAEESLAAVFSSLPTPRAAATEVTALHDSERITKATQYVQKSSKALMVAQVRGATAGQELHTWKHHYFMALETETRQIVITEMLPDGTVLWNENPEILEARLMDSKAIQVADCREAGITLGAAKRYCTDYLAGQCSTDGARCYAEGLCAMVAPVASDTTAGQQSSLALTL